MTARATSTLILIVSMAIGLASGMHIALYLGVALTLFVLWRAPNASEAHIAETPSPGEAEEAETPEDTLHEAETPSDLWAWAETPSLFDDVPSISTYSEEDVDEAYRNGYIMGISDCIKMLNEVQELFRVSSLRIWKQAEQVYVGYVRREVVYPAYIIVHKQVRRLFHRVSATALDRSEINRN